jgi:hypothetical protein
MSKVTVKCDRCDKMVDGIENEIGTAGFYRLDGYWSKFKRDEVEKVICDDCMWIDPKYIKEYPGMILNRSEE